MRPLEILLISLRIERAEGQLLLPQAFGRPTHVYLAAGGALIALAGFTVSIEKLAQHQSSAGSGSGGIGATGSFRHEPMSSLA